MEFHLTATGRHLPYGITQCCLPPDTSERAPPSPQPVSRYSIYLPRRDGRLSWPRLPGNAPAGNRTRDLSITSPTPNHYTNRATNTLARAGKSQVWNVSSRSNAACTRSVYTPLIQHPHEWLATRSSCIFITLTWRPVFPGRVLVLL